ncbi:MAG: hypothetical protein K2Q22_02340, partial [Cytophagales bacterium]|nr:hypothetical protein [Cytophagales bacterium]
MKKTFHIILGLVCISCIGYSQEIWPSGTTGVGGSYNLTFPPGPYTYPNNPPSSCGSGAPAASFYQRPGADYFRSAVASPKVVSGFSQLPQTNDWWTSAIWNYETTCNWVIAPYSFWMYPHPLQVAGTRYGMKISYEPSPTITPITYFYQSETHLYVGLQGMDVPASTGMKVKGYSDWAATFQWNDGTRNLEATSAHGSPYVYFNKNASSTFTLRYQVNPGTAFATINNSSVYAIGVNILGKYYGIFMPPGSSLSGYYGLNYNEANVPAEVPTANATRDAQNINTPVGHNYFSVAVLPDNSPATLAYYAQFAFAFISDTQVSWAYNQATSQLNSTFTVTTAPQGSSTETNTLMALYRHQWLNTSSPTTAYSYVSARGQMKVVQGNSFTTNITQYGLLNGLPNVGTHNKTTLYSYVDAVYNDNMNNVAYHMNHLASLYDVGVKVDRMVDLIHIADAVGHTAAKTKFLSYLKTALEYWLQSPVGKSNQMFWYDPLWKTLVAYPQAFESDRQLNDHHFHYGYIIKGAATIIQYESNNTWLTQWGPMVEQLIRDVANWDRTNTQYPFLRNFDPYAGHSWASGHANFPQGNNQESSSEALNFAAGVTLYGTNSGNSTLRDLGLFLYANEVAATQQYWFDINNATFPASYTKVSSGIVWGRSSEYQTWFGGDPEYVHAINYLPITGASFYLGWDSLYAAQNYAGMVANNGGIETVAAGWRDLFWMYQALFDPATAKSKFTANASTYIPQTGQSKPFTYLWISMLDSIGKPYNIT